ncbi:LysR family transcriptional regulator [Methylosinus sp. Sm6]|uniref:LysR family transcriptional regulator n=1 Tax=Methylosinus sp. Sm6 TaxID=2866948 RepID=UPI001C996BF5|nr:LysR family transcriptional regulator [Methylosinus sp. Sm6]MBY6242226.1 LysR family transcriptional regulator [Methylosinus sp. Sm6]
MDLAAALRAFVRSVERGSMTAAATDLGVSQPAVSKLLRNLENHVGAKLVERGARVLRLTPQGAALYEAAGGGLALIDAAIEGVRGDGGAIEGRLRLHGPACIGERHLHGLVMQFQDRHPRVRVELFLDNHPIDLVQENVDLALRMERPADRRLVMRRIGYSRRILVASPDYLARHGPVRRCEELSEADVIVTNASLRGDALPLRRGKERTAIPLRPKLTTNNAQVLLDALKAGRGVGTAQLLLVAEDLAQGRLVRVLPDYEIEPTEFFLVYPSSKYLRPTVRAFIDFAAPALRRIEGIF